MDNEFLKTFETKTVKHKDLFLRMKVKKTLPMRTPFVTSISVHYNKQILCTRFGNHIRQTDKSKLDWKTPMKLFFYAIVCWLSKKTVQFPYLRPLYTGSVFSATLPSFFTSGFLITFFANFKILPRPWPWCWIAAGGCRGLFAGLFFVYTVFLIIYLQVVCCSSRSCKKRSSIW